MTKDSSAIGSVLFLDIVGYSKLKDDQQKEKVTSLSQHVLHVLKKLECNLEETIIVPTGDGMGICFFDNSPLLPLETSSKLQSISQTNSSNENQYIPLRMGINIGGAFRITDATGHVNVCGAGMNIAARVMSFGDTGHILCSESTAEIIRNMNNEVASLFDDNRTYEVEVKHGIKLRIFNIAGNYRQYGSVGNPKKPSKIEKIERKVDVLRFKGLSDQEIGFTLELKEDTVKNIIVRLLQEKIDRE